MIDDRKCYDAWRRSEAYQVPMTEEGLRRADERYDSFKKGYYAGLNAAAYTLEKLHSENKRLHRFYLIASETIRALTK